MILETRPDVDNELEIRVADFSNVQSLSSGLVLIKLKYKMETHQIRSDFETCEEPNAVGLPYEGQK